MAQADKHADRTANKDRSSVRKYGKKISLSRSMLSKLHSLRKPTAKRVTIKEDTGGAQPGPSIESTKRDEFLKGKKASESQYSAYMKQLAELQRDLKDDQAYAHYLYQKQALKGDSSLIESCVGKSEKSLLRAHRLINEV